MRLLLLVLLALQTVATVKTPKTVTLTVTNYEVLGVFWGAPPGLVTPPPPGVPPEAMPLPPWTVGGSAVWLLQILYRDNTGVYRVDPHAGVYNPNANTNGADQLVQAMLAAPNQQQWALQHLLDEGKIPPSTIQSTPITIKKEHP